MKKMLVVMFIISAACLGLNSCFLLDDEERKPQEPTSGTSEKPWNQMQKFEENSMFRSMERRR